MDRLCSISGLPRGRISVLQGTPGSGRLSLALALLALATREFARVVVSDCDGGPDPWTVERLGGDLRAMTLVRPPTRVAVGEAAVALSRAGASWCSCWETCRRPRWRRWSQHRRVPAAW